MSYIDTNKEAWEEAFDNRAPDWGEDIVRRVRSEEYPFFVEEMAAALRARDLRGATVGQFCSNNGRELLSLVRSAGAKRGLGFDIAENQVAFANAKAAELGLDCRFAATDILRIGDEYRDMLDAAIITIGALCWFEDLAAFFGVVSRCLKEGALLLVHEQHPVANMLGLPGDEDYAEGHPANFAHSYFRKVWMSNDGIDYITGRSYPSKTFTDFTHPFSEIVGAMCGAGFRILSLREYERDISGMFGRLEGKGIPLSYIVEAEKLSCRDPSP
jgi:SAM-dependent methyltransferase